MKTTPTYPVPPFSAGGSPAFTVWLLLGLVALLALHQRAGAQGLVPERFSFQGYMEDGNGQPLGPSTPANYAMIFRIYPVATGGATPLWAERQIVTFDKGNYSVILGQGTQNGGEAHGDLSAVVATTAGSELYVQSVVNINGSDVTINPRLRLLPTTYAFLAKKALSADQALSVQGNAIAAGSIQQDRLSPAVVSNIVSAPIPDVRLSTNVAVRSGGNTFAGNQTINGNVGISTPAGAGKLLVNGGVRARGGAPGSAGANDNGYAFSGNGGDNDSGMFSSAEGQLEFYTDSVERMRIANGSVGINTPTPTATLDVNGSVKATSVTANGITVNGTVSATSFNGTFNGEKPPVSGSTTTASLNTVRDVLIDATSVFNDSDGGRIRMLVRNFGDQSVRVWTWEFYSDTPNLFGTTSTKGTLRYNDGGENFFVLGDPNIRSTLWNINGWVTISNYKVIGNGSPFGPADRFKFYITVQPNISVTTTFLDR